MKVLRVLVACEESQAVCKEFRRLGHEAYSCDVQECSGGHPEWHHTGDVLPLLKLQWDLMIAFPPCTYLCSSGMHWTTRGLRDPQLTEDALELVSTLLNSKIAAIALENPVGCISSRIRKPEQIIQPWYFGDDASKKTCLWLKGLPELDKTNIVPPNGWSKVAYASDMLECEMCEEPFCPEHNDHYADCECIGPTQDDATYKKICGVEFASLLNEPPKPVWANQTASGQNKLGPSPERAKLRSKTYSGIARAMAEQWSAYLCEEHNGYDDLPLFGGLDNA